MGFRGQFAQQRSWARHVRFGSKADIPRCGKERRYSTPRRRPSPALDRIAADGLRFTNFNSTALCSPGARLNAMMPQMFVSWSASA
jgi:hypothetical protein